VAFVIKFDLQDSRLKLLSLTFLISKKHYAYILKTYIMFTVQTYRTDKKLGINILNSIYSCTRAFEWGNPVEVYK